MCGSRKFCQKGSNFDSFFDEGGVDPSTTISGPSTTLLAKRHLMAFRWRVDDDPTLNAGLIAL